MLEVTSASQANLLLVVTSNQKEAPGLCSQVFDYIPVTVNTEREAAKYDSQDQVFSFSHKQGCSSSSQGPWSSTPYCTVTTAFNRTFDISQISPLASASAQQDAAVIAAEVSVATVAQASKEFHCMHEPKITKLKGCYLADTELILACGY